jgi:hypothetical protein
METAEQLKQLKEAFEAARDDADDAAAANVACSIRDTDREATHAAFEAAVDKLIVARDTYRAALGL